jgi:hypothetical protein
VIKRVAALAALGPLVLSVSLLLLICFPRPLFAHSISFEGLTLYSDKPFVPEAGTQVLAMAKAKLVRSPLYREGEEHAVFICNERWRQRIFFTYVYGVGGVNYYPITTNVYLRDADIAANRLIGPSGQPLAADRSLDYFIAHEITHTLTGRRVGGLGNRKLPRWVREGYADHVARGTTFDYASAVRALAAADRTMDYEKSGLYLRYNLLVAHLLDREGWTVERLLDERIEQADVERAVREAASLPTVN